MLYDEEGRAYIEPPLLPEDVHLRYIVQDYQRMYRERGKLERKIESLGDTNTRMAHYNFFMRGIVKEQLKLIDDLVKRLNNRGHKIETKTADRIEDFRKIAYPSITSKKK